MGFGFGFGLNLERWQAGGAAPVGPVVTVPGALDGTTFRVGTAHTITAGTATPTGGGSVSYETRWLVGAAEVAGASYTPQPAEDGLAIAAQWRAVETGGSNDGASFWQTVGAGTVSYPAPEITASDSRTGRTLTITVDTLSAGASAALTALTRDGTDVVGEVVGTGPWAYAVPSSAQAETLAWTVTATSTGGTATASGADSVPPDLFAPSAAGGITDRTYATGVAIAPLDIAADFTGTAPITFALAPASVALPAGLSLSPEGLLTGTPSEVVNRTLIVRGTNAYGADETGLTVTVTAAAAWDLSGGAGALTLSAAPPIPAPTVTGGAGALTVTE